jgi:hypothetical protein
VKIVGKTKQRSPRDLLQQGQRLRDRVQRWNPYPRIRGRVFKFRTWEELEKWRLSQTNPRVR